MVADASMLNKLSPFATLYFRSSSSKRFKRYQVFCPVFRHDWCPVRNQARLLGNLGMAAGLIGSVGASLAYTMVRMLNGVQRAVIVFCFSAFNCP